MDPTFSLQSEPLPKDAPLIIPRPKHPISRSQIDEEALKVLYRLFHHGFLAYLVGGSVRDLLLGKVPKDFDVATNAHPHEIHQLFRNSRIIGRRFRLVHIFFKGGKVIEVSTFRSHSEFEEIETEEGAVIRRDSFGSPNEDAFRRDITINGLFYNIADFSIIDYVGGMADLKGRIIRTIGNPDERFRQDPVRMIRVIRHAARTGFIIEEKTYQAILEHRDEIRSCSPSRLRDEFLRDLKEGATEFSLALMLETGLLLSLFPDLDRTFGERNPLRGETKRYLLALFHIADELHKLGRPVPEPVTLGLFLIPFLHTALQKHPFLGEKTRLIYRTQTIRCALSQILDPFSFPRDTKEIASQVLVAQAYLRKLADRELVPKRLRQRRFFREAVLLLGIEAKAKGEEVPHGLLRAVPRDLLPWWQKELQVLDNQEKRGKQPPRRRRHRRFRKRKPFTP